LRYDVHPWLITGPSHITALNGMRRAGLDPSFEEVGDMVQEFMDRGLRNMGQQVFGVPVILSEWQKTGKVIPRIQQ
jgi:hypothetical protein